MRNLCLLLVLILALASCGDTDLATTSSDGPRVSTSTTSVAAATTVSPSTTATPSDTTVDSTSTTTTTAPLRPLSELSLEAFEAGAGFGQPVLMLTGPGESGWFIVDQPGTIWVVNDGETSVFLDIEDLVQFQGEQGLLGMAFHPDFRANSLIYVNYINNDGDTIVASFEAQGQSGDRDSLTEILRVEQPAGNHNGGMIEFGPDGNLWIGFGDGGGSDDQFGQGQRTDTMLASMVRISVGPDIDGYSIPDGNLQEEVWAIGLRNPWRFSFDGDDLWIADVGQNRIEEVDVVDWTDGNPNFGWSVMEGTECFRSDGCESSDLVAPVYEYTHGDGCSVTGGYVYRGQSIPELTGQYFFAEYCSGWVRSVDRTGVMTEWLPAGTLAGAIGFGQDSTGELYVLTLDGRIHGIREAP